MTSHKTTGTMPDNTDAQPAHSAPSPVAVPPAGPGVGVSCVYVVIDDGCIDSVWTTLAGARDAVKRVAHEHRGQRWERLDQDAYGYYWGGTLRTVEIQDYALDRDSG